MAEWACLFPICLKILVSVEFLETNRNPANGGGLAEWLKAHAWKACGRNPSQVRILYPPPLAGESEFAARHHRFKSCTLCSAEHRFERPGDFLYKNNLFG